MIGEAPKQSDLISKKTLQCYEEKSSWQLLSLTSAVSHLGLNTKSWNYVTSMPYSEEDAIIIKH